MEFRCRPFSVSYYAIEFLSQIEEATVVLEVLQVLNHLEYFMSMNDYFETNLDKGKVSYMGQTAPVAEAEGAELYVGEPNDKAKKPPGPDTMNLANNLF